jgi:glycosyltransferase involved in cell wall biosynthesis
LRGHVVFHGWSRNIEEVYADLDALALTSINEGTPVSIIEAMAASVPVITTSVGGTSDLIGSCRIDRFHIGRHGILCRSGDVNGLVEGIEFLLSDASGRIPEMVHNAREYVRDHYSINRMIHEIEYLYDAIVTGKGRRRALRNRPCASRTERPPVAEGCFDN